MAPVYERLMFICLLISGALVAVAGGPLHAASPAPVQAGCDLPNLRGATRTFPETGYTVTGSFSAYWNWNGGLAQQGYPISDVMQEVSELDGKPYLVQYFERAVFECHPENAGTAFAVLLSQLGTYQYHQKYPQGAPGQRPNGEHPAYFAETGHTLGGEFRTYWERHGGLLQQGYPLSDEFTEISPLDGKPYTVQYFERAVFEYHSENQPPYRVLLSQLGTLRCRAKYSTMPGPSPTPDAGRPQFLGNVRPGGKGNLVAAGPYIFWLDANSPWGDPSILGYDAQAERQLVVTQAPRYKGDLVTDGRTVAWRELPNGPNQAEYIHGYRLRTGQEFPPMQDEKHRLIVEFAVDDDRLYYVTRESAAGFDNELYVYNWTTGQTALVATAAAHAYFLRPVAGNGVVVWSELDPDAQRLQLHLARAGTPTNATVLIRDSPGLPDYIIAGDHVLWTQAGLHIYTIRTGTAQVLPQAGGDHLSAYANLVAWRQMPPDATAGAPLIAAVPDLATGQTRVHELPSSGEYDAYVALVGPAALAYVGQEANRELYLQPLR